MGCVGIGPIEKPDELADALSKAIAEVKACKPVVVDVVTAKR
jgi:hypothetical protein